MMDNQKYNSNRFDSMPRCVWAALQNPGFRRWKAHSIVRKATPAKPPAASSARPQAVFQGFLPKPVCGGFQSAVF